jgi:hypothetical protein
MISPFERAPWLWWPLLSAIALAIVYAGGAYYYSPLFQGQRKLKASGFTGMVRECAKFTLLGSGAGLLSCILVAELKPYPYVRQAMLAILIISIVATALNFWMGASIDNKIGDDGKSVTLESNFWVIVHGVIFGLSLAAVLTFLVVVVTFAASV